MRLNFSAQIPALVTGLLVSLSIPTIAAPASQPAKSKTTHAVPSAPNKTTSTTPVKVSVDAALPTATVKPVDYSNNPYGLNAQEAEFVDRVNRERTSRGLNALTVDPLLIQDAREHSAEMCTLNYFDHRSPTSGMTMPMDRYLKALERTNQSTPAYVLVGENIYYCSVLNAQYSIEYAHQSLMNSPGHRANILEPRFEKIGIGTYRNAKGEFWVTEAFLRDDAPDGASSDMVPSNPN